MPDYMPYMQMMGMPGQHYPMMSMPYENLEMMYPRCYHIIYPHVKHHCDMFDARYGMMYTPTREQLEAMVDDIHRKVEVDVDIEINLPRENDDRQLGFGGRNLLRDLIFILLLRQFLGRRRPFGGFGGFGGFGF